jgi:hypothetical protein
VVVCVRFAFVEVVALPSYRHSRVCVCVCGLVVVLSNACQRMFHSNETLDRAHCSVDGGFECVGLCCFRGGFCSP